MSKKLIAQTRNARTSLSESLHFGLYACVKKLEAKNDTLRQHQEDQS